MADGFSFSIFKDTILRRVDLVYPDRSVQFKEVEKLSKEGDQNEAISPYAASLLTVFLRCLMDIQTRNTAPATKASVEAVMKRISDICENLDLKNLSPLILDQLHSISTQIFAHCICHLVYFIHMDIYRHCDRLDRMIDYWSERTPEGKKWWYLVEKTPFFWARYFGLFYKKGNQLPHPETEVALRVAWLKRMKLALHYFLGKSHYTLTLCELHDVDDVEKLMATMKLDIETLEAVLHEVFTVPGVIFENDDIEKQHDPISTHSDTSADHSARNTQGTALDDQQNISSPLPPTASLLPSSTAPNQDTEPNDAISAKRLGATGGLKTRMAENLSPAQAVLATSRPNLRRAMTNSNLGRPGIEGQTPLGSPRSGVDTTHIATSSSTAPTMHSPVRPDLPSQETTFGVTTPQGTGGQDPQKGNEQNPSILASQAHQDSIMPKLPRHSVQRVVVENLDGSLNLTAPAVDGMVQEYRNLEKTSRLHLLSRLTAGNSQKALHRRSFVRNLRHTMVKEEQDARKVNFASNIAQSSSVGDSGALNDDGMTVSYAQRVPSAKKKEEEENVKFKESQLKVSEEGGDEVEDDVERMCEVMIERRREVERLVSVVENVMSVVALKMSQNDIPAVYERQWLMCCVVGGLSLYGGVKVVRNWSKIKMAFLSTKASIGKFFYEHAYEPLVSIWKTIRYEELSEVGVMTKENLEDDVESLVRMVDSFHRSKSKVPISDADALILADQARSGVIPSIMTSYENEISHPIRNALAGDLLQLALIQVQKQKVDIEKAMAQLDRLLKQNQINFQLLALLPSAVFFSLSSYLITHYYFHRDPYHHQHRLIRSLLRQLAKTINQSHSESSLSPNSSIIHDILSISANQEHPYEEGGAMGEDDFSSSPTPSLPTLASLNAPISQLQYGNESERTNEGLGTSKLSARSGENRIFGRFERAFSVKLLPTPTPRYHPAHVQQLQIPQSFGLIV